jgi:hypothetical protein
VSLSLLQKLDLQGRFALPLFVSKLTALKDLALSTNDVVMAPLKHLTWLTGLDIVICWDTLTIIMLPWLIIQI